jgi:hypothetical protein
MAAAARRCKLGARPQALPVQAEHVPADLRLLDQWVLWRYAPSGNGRWDKPPFDPRTGRMADATDPATWAPFAAALDRLRHRPGAYNGLGFVFAADDPYAGVDLDGSRDASTARLAFWTGRDPGRMDALFRSSGLMRPKWDERRGQDTYGRRTLRFAVETCRAVRLPLPGPADRTPPDPSKNQLCTMYVSHACTPQARPSGSWHTSGASGSATAGRSTSRPGRRPASSARPRRPRPAGWSNW